MSANKDMPKTIKSYKIEKETYKLSNSVLYTGTNTDINEKVLIDVYQKEKIKSRVDEVSFLNNGVFFSKLLNHKNILKLYEIIETPTYVFQIYEYFNGTKLSDYIKKKKKLPDDEVIEILKEVLGALAYLHDMNICHLNLNSNDILVDEKKNVKLYNFDFSHFYSSKNKSRAGLLINHDFTCSEFYSQKMYNGELADMWSFGVLAFHMLTGKLPFEAKKDLDLIKLIIKGEYTLPNTVNAKFQELIKGLIEVKEEKRMKISDLFNNALFKEKKITKDSLTKGLNIFETNYPIDPVIIDICKNNLGLDDNAITKALNNNQFTPLTSLYKQVVSKFVNKGIASISDLVSAKFKDYIKDPKNLVKESQQMKNLQIYLKKEEEEKKGTKDLAAILFNNQNEISTRLGDINRHYENLKKGIASKVKMGSFDKIQLKREYKLIEKDEVKASNANKRNTVCFQDMSEFQFANKDNPAGAKNQPAPKKNNVKPVPSKIVEVKEEEDEKKAPAKNNISTIKPANNPAPKKVEPPKPKVEPPKPKVEPPKPKVEPAKPKVEPAKPKVEPPKPKVEPAKPKVEPPKPKVEPPKPKVEPPKAKIPEKKPDEPKPAASSNPFLAMMGKKLKSVNDK